MPATTAGRKTCRCVCISRKYAFEELLSDVTAKAHAEWRARSHCHGERKVEVLAIGAARQGGRHDQLAGIASAQSILRMLRYPRHHTPTILTQTLSFPCCKYRCDLTLSRWLYLMLQGLRTITKNGKGGVWEIPPHRCVLRSASLQGEQHICR
jgi:hypothetical protein